MRNSQTMHRVLRFQTVPFIPPRLILGAACEQGLEILEGRTLLSTYVVNNTTDTHVDGQLTLREAILAADSNAGADQITFASGISAVSLDSALPDITDTLLLDGRSG